MRSSLSRLGALAGALSLATAPTLFPAAEAADRPEGRDPGAAAAGCFWFGPTGRVDESDDNYAFPDSGARYWAAIFTLPPGAHLSFDHEFAHARYQSLNSYATATHAPTDALNDVSTVPDPGSRNPYLPGADRAAHAKRSYTATVTGSGAPADPADRAPNTLYAGVAGQREISLVYRVYLPDRNTEPDGGAGLPRPTLHLADGSTVTGSAVCDAVQAEDRTAMPVTYLP
ncbi:hypothetical protein, partial [Streptomyces sp. NRRL B-24572]|uniref:hypothetical protein n=1 Tax=Streptomyces sp. NRRL B-24572 TaxID=1962156 RepID=UPI00211AEAD0